MARCFHFFFCRQKHIVCVRFVEIGNLCCGVRMLKSAIGGTFDHLMCLLKLNFMKWGQLIKHLL